jgi:hypothetical protein
MTDFVVHPDATVDYPDTGGYTMSPEELSGLDTPLAWSAVQPEPDLPLMGSWTTPLRHADLSFVRARPQVAENAMRAVEKADNTVGRARVEEGRS